MSTEKNPCVGSEEQMRLDDGRCWMCPGCNDQLMSHPSFVAPPNDGYSGISTESKKAMFEWGVRQQCGHNVPGRIFLTDVEITPTEQPA